MIKTTIDYAELARRVGDCILFNNHNVHNTEWWCELLETPLLRARLDEEDIENGILPDDDQAERASVTDTEIYQSYHITSGGAEYLMNHTSELLSYDETLDVWIWHISHFGTSWSGVHTTHYDYSDDNDHKYINANDYKHYTIG